MSDSARMTPAIPAGHRESPDNPAARTLGRLAMAGIGTAILIMIAASLVRQDWMRPPLVMPRPGRDNLRVDARKLAAEADVEDIEREGHEYFPEDAPGHSENDL